MWQYYTTYNICRWRNTTVNLASTDRDGRTLKVYKVYVPVTKKAAQLAFPKAFV